MMANREQTSARALVAAFFVVAGATLASSCTTSLRLVKCEGGPYRCGDEQDVKFCEFEATAVEGAGCGEVGVASGKRFCVVAHDGCASTQYAVKDGDCSIREFRAIREWRECSPGVPTFEP